MLVAYDVAVDDIPTHHISGGRPSPYGERKHDEQAIELKNVEQHGAAVYI